MNLVNLLKRHAMTLKKWKKAQDNGRILAEAERVTVQKISSRFMNSTGVI